MSKSMKLSLFFILGVLLSGCVFGPTTNDLAEEIEIELQFIISKSESPCMECAVEVRRFFNGPTIFSWGNYGIISRIKTDETGRVRFSTNMNGTYEISLVTEIEEERLVGFYGFKVPGKNSVGIVNVEAPLITRPAN